MSSLLRATIPAYVRTLRAPNYRLTCSAALWHSGLAELARRGGGQRESGAFLLGTRVSVWRRARARIVRFVYYDDLDATCLDRGIVIFDGRGFGPLWELCRSTGLTVVADVHTHPGAAQQSGADKVNPMIAVPGHIAIIVPKYARPPVAQQALGIYEYQGSHTWRDQSRTPGFFYLTR